MTKKTMNHDKWMSKRSMLSDLAQVTGTGTYCLDGLTTVRDKPPAVYQMEDDEEFEMRFGKHNHKENYLKGPDLSLIKLMLKTVNEDDNDDDEISNHESDMNEAGTILNISRLNPNVKEFVPQSKQTTIQVNKQAIGTSDKENYVSNNDSIPLEEHNTTVEQTVEDLTIKNIKYIKSESPLKNNQRNINSTDSYVPNNTSVQLKEHKTTTKQTVEELMLENINNFKSKLPLKNKSELLNIQLNDRANGNIISVTKNDLQDVSVKFEQHNTTLDKAAEELKLKIQIGIKSEPPLKNESKRNAAIMSLLKLHSAKPAKPLKLMTPDYFTKSCGKPAPNTPPVPIQLDGDELIPSVKQPCDNEIHNEKEVAVDISIEDKNDQTNLTCQNETLKDSIEKVNNWFEAAVNPQKSTKSFRVGPFTYKRKPHNPERSPQKSVSSTRNSSPHCVEYIPSELAKELYEQYSKVSGKTPSNVDTKANPWTRVQKELCERDERIKMRKIKKFETTNPDCADPEY